MERKVNVIEDIDGKKTVFIHDIIFRGKKSVKWDDAEEYLATRKVLSQVRVSCLEWQNTI